MLRRDLAHLVEQLAQDLAVVREVALARTRCRCPRGRSEPSSPTVHAVGQFEVVVVGVEVARTSDAMSAMRAVVAVDGASSASSTAASSLPSVRRNASTELSSRLSRLTVMSFWMPCSRLALAEVRPRLPFLPSTCRRAPRTSRSRLGNT